MMEAFNGPATYFVIIGLFAASFILFLRYIWAPQITAKIKIEM